MTEFILSRRKKLVTEATKESEMRRAGEGGDAARLGDGDRGAGLRGLTRAYTAIS